MPEVALKFIPSLDLTGFSKDCSWHADLKCTVSEFKLKIQCKLGPITLTVQLASRLILSMIMIIENMTLFMDHKLVFKHYIQN